MIILNKKVVLFVIINKFKKRCTNEYSKELEDLIKNEVLEEIEDYIDELFEILLQKRR